MWKISRHLSVCADASCQLSPVLEYPSSGSKGPVAPLAPAVPHLLDDDVIWFQAKNM